MKRRSIIMDASDDVATVLTDLKAGDQVAADPQGKVNLQLQNDIAFGHKFALHDIAAGDSILKYGLPIGKALEDIEAGEWVHVHNCRSEHFGFHRDQYGLKA